MHIRFASPADLDTCLQLDASFETERVWSLNLKDSRDQVNVQLRASELPRLLRVTYPIPGDALLMHWQRGYCVMIAEDLESGAMLGYADLGPEPDLQTGWLWHLVVDRSQRRRGVGSALLAAAFQWSSQNQLRRLMTPIQTQNDPGIHFCHRHGLSFCGFNDRFYQNGSVALFFGCELR